jgi:ABC-type dipeptide/oligopeptide/nickel transport system permease subunit
MLRASYPYLQDQPWLPLAPGIPVFLVVLAINFLGDGLRDALDPKLKSVRHVV